MYTIINQTSAISNRLNKGTNARVKVIGGNVVKYPQDLADVDWEVEILHKLEEVGFTSCPTLVDWTSSSLTLSLINSAGTLQDYLGLYATNPTLYRKEMEEIWEVTKEVIYEFHDLGFVHGDLHSLNIVYEYDGEWHPHLIDFSTSYHEDNVDEYCDMKALIPEELYNSEGDWEFLEEYIRDNYPGEEQELDFLTY